jgi:hypothetical protein
LRTILAQVYYAPPYTCCVGSVQLDLRAGDAAAGRQWTKFVRTADGFRKPIEQYAETISEKVR